MTKEQFHTSFVDMVNKLNIDTETLSRNLKLSKSTIQRYIDGESAPHRLGREAIFKVFK